MAVDKNIQKKANDIRTKQYGSEVRESLASGLEEMSADVVENESRQTNVEGQFQAVLDETTGKDVISAPEITASRVGADGSSHANLKARLDAEQQSVTAQLAQTAKRDVVFNALNNKRNKSDLIGFNDADEELLNAIQMSVEKVEVNSIPKDKSVSIEKTDFVHRGTNKFDGKFLKGYGLLGASPNIKFLENPNAYVAITHLESKEPVVISKGNSDRFGVSLFESYPKVNDVAKRVITTSTFSGEEVKFTPEANENYVVVFVSSPNESTPPAWLQIEYGNTATEFVGYDQVNLNLGKNSIPPITPKMTSFIKPGRNLFNGTFLDDVYLANPTHDGSLIIKEGNGGKVVIFEAEKGETYSISRSDDTDRYSIGVTEQKPRIDIPLDRVINDNTTKWINKTITLQGDERYIVLGISSQSQNSTPKRLQIEKGSQITKYTPPNSVSLLLETPIMDSDEKIVWFGDSISELMSLPELVSERIDKEIINVSIAGSVMSYHTNASYKNVGFKELTNAIISDNWIKQEQAIEDIKQTGVGVDRTDKLNLLKNMDWNSVDKIVAFYGRNDYGSHVPIGTGGDSSIEKDFKAGMEKGIKNILTIFPHIQFYFITPIWNTDGDTVKAHKLVEYGEAILEVSKEYNYPSFDLYHNCGFNELNKHVFLKPDGIHQTELGNSVLVNKISGFLSTH